MVDSATEIRVPLAAGQYSIWIESSYLAQLGTRLREHFADVSRFIIITDEHVARYYGEVIHGRLQQAGLDSAIITIPAGEESKSVAEAQRIWQALVDLGADRRSMILAFGGGVVGDLAGFTAATYVRGIRYCQIPTTLLAQVDSSIGGKVGINLPQAKNMVGCFWQPQLVIADVSLLGTLPEREYRSGLGEVVKYGMILDAELFTYLEKHTADILARGPTTLQFVVERCCALKAGIVAEDERDMSGRRAILNYGHTMGHAIEQCSGYGTWLHGEAVAMGMHLESRLAVRRGWIDESLVDRQANLLSALKLPTTFQPTSIESFMAAMARDKKTVQSRIQFVLPRSLGHVALCNDAAESDIRAVLQDE